MSPRPVPPELARLVAQIQLVEWPLWTEPAARTRREVVELCRLQAARGLTLLSWLAQDGLDGTTPHAIRPAPTLPAPSNHPPETPTAIPPVGSAMRSRASGTLAVWEQDLGWLLDTRRLGGGRRERMYAAADGLPLEVRELVVANWTWALGTPHGGQATAAYLAGGAYPDDGYSAARATVALLRLWERRPEYRTAMAAAWAATRTPADWCKAAELRAAYGAAVPIFSYPRVPLPRTTVRPWIVRLLGVRKDHCG
ncbi:hypothetical protein [Actinomadura rudentiformis]|uniref:Uncharacterized protein n=1 Tax=Actinomadura rudentiformis TaxID=359158 RepID=A0A6H9Z6N5_9ACTN|nr:hypothetical protein [Actinomadura rudentiformis]KAB2350830.1 hypothetical protein F8566_07630 [Actinomadura rudentiformis]